LLAVAVTVAATTAGVAVSGLPGQADVTGGSPGSEGAVSDRPVTLTVTVSGDVVRLVHRGGDRVDVRELSLTVYVDGTPLATQPPVPFFSAPGFVSGPTGPFNSAADPQWSPGEPATLVVADGNDPGVAPGDRVTVVMTRDNRTIARDTATARKR
jgi:hypothetical protein